MPHADWHIALTLGVLLTAALACGLLAHSLRLPRVTAYLLVGLALGPQLLHAITEDDLVVLDPVGKLAMAMVLFNMGCHFTLVHLRRVLKRVARLSAGELGLTFFLVSAGLFLFGESWPAAMLLGAMAMATAPATTMLVLAENESQGPVTEYATAMVALNNLAAVILFEVLFLIVRHSHGDLTVPMRTELGAFASDLSGSLLLGAAGGLVVSYSCSVFSTHHWLVIIVAASTLLLGVCETLGVPYLLTFLAMGAAVANASERPKEIVAELDRVTGLLCVVFFVIQGAELDFRKPFEAGDTGVMYVGLAYIVLRATGKYFGVYLAAKGQHDGPQVRQWLGAALLSQAGAALALSSIASDPSGGLEELGERLQLVILGTVVVFELVGPILVRQAVLRSGEVPLSEAIHHSTTTPLDQLRQLAARILAAFGAVPWRGRSPEELSVGQFMRRNVSGIPSSAAFIEVVEFIEHSHDNTFPVVDPEDGSLAGVIHYSDLRDVLFDTELTAAVNALDVAVPARRVLRPEDTLRQAWEQFRHIPDDCLPVVTREAPHQLIGLMRRRDLFNFFARRPETKSGNHGIHGIHGNE